MTQLARLLCTALFVFVGSGDASAQSQASPPPAPGSDGVNVFGRCEHSRAARATPRGQPRPLRGTTQLCLEDRSGKGFTDLFNGRDLTGWEGAPGRWSVENGVLVGRTTLESKLAANTFLIWKGRPMADFDLQFEWRLSAGGNSGLQYRSSRVTGREAGPFVLKGPQFDMGGGDGEAFTGNLFEERGPTFLATRGSFAIDFGDRRETIGFVGGSKGSPGGYRPTRDLIEAGGWNRGEIVARGGTVVHLINGQVVGIVLDEARSRLTRGVFGIQLHVGPPMTIEFRTIRFRALP